ncbi:hypothetical protein COO09_05260 [Rhizorhabdus dicambivorans]|uniref:Uncharacterized protein n=2 Tax=Rhizorhabdus dicambivorans TaxID=1850238 RepID=A0A2A4FZN2_9SPHN|nr:hypothetical protein CMV14_00225 [Rhizorhabdus dicambivorans]PCE43193.1 hypothetical protein COO09_05260 [Rhizorhabdus dicambivorans]
MVWRFLLPTLVAASCGLILSDAADWLRFGFWPSLDGSAGLEAVVACVLGSFVAVLVLAAVWRWASAWAERRAWACPLLGALLFWVPVAALGRQPLLALMVVPGGLAAGYLWRALALGRLGRWSAVVILSVCCAILLLPAIQTARAGLEDRRIAAQAPVIGGVKGGQVHRSELWLHDHRGKLVSLRLGDWHPTERAARNVMAMAADGDALWVLRAPPPDYRLDRQSPGRFVLARHHDRDWTVLPAMRFGADDRPLALSVREGRIAVVTQQHLFVTDTARPMWRSIALDRPIELDALVSAHLVDRNRIVVGTNLGEFGGSLTRIDMNDAAPARITHICRADPSGACDPVTALDRDPLHPGCTLVGMGLSHLGFSRGGVSRLCGSRLTPLFERPRAIPLGVRLGRLLGLDPPRRDGQSEPVFGLAVAGDTVWVATNAGIYRLHAGQTERYDLPAFQTVHQLALSKRIPGIVMVASEANMAWSMSGYTPLIFTLPKAQ